MRTVLLVVVLAVACPLPISAAAARSDCSYEGRFRTLYDMVPAAVGACSADEVAIAGGSYQYTSNGRLRWVEATGSLEFHDQDGLRGYLLVRGRLWYTTDDGASFWPAPTPPYSTSNPAPRSIQDGRSHPCGAGQIKGDMHSGTYHMPRQQNYAITGSGATANITCFVTQAEARSAGLTPSQL
jgi:hypothetical protein